MFDKKTPVALDAWLKRTRGNEITPVRREVVAVRPEDLLDIDATTNPDTPPVLCLTGESEGASLFANGWLPRIAAAGSMARSVSLRGQGQTVDADGGEEGRVHDLVQEVVLMPRQSVLIGHGTAAATVVAAATRYPASAVVLIDPVRTKPQSLPLVGQPPVLIVAAGSEVAATPKRLQKLTASFNVDPLLFPGQENLISGPGWESVLDAILSWLKQVESNS
ncbi:alpha/beta fold hydrolase [Natronoglycomyces albus]|uniref:Alpha/beta hydrolase n=1 Tax=Natronoglycomyces albus TaxID=2811108 RepID=A0A895XSK7_9ACTN|nr:alpha/beta fold hydrolase [Natronoglycomyces albus]QSB06309.1 hypothetical protein JQS30_05210 [Natronoglycomyces albus]